MNDVRKKIEITCFAMLNLLFSIPGSMLFFAIGLGGFISKFIFHADPIGEDDGYYVVYSFLSFFFFNFIKLFFLIFFYLFRKFLPFVREYLEKFEFDTKFRNKVLGASIILDVMVFIISFLTFYTFSFDGTVFCWLANCGGVLTSYLILLIFLKIKNFFQKKFCR